jgi:hypothetical protein
MARKFDAATLDFLRTTQEIGIRTGKRPDRGVIIWAVVVGDAAFVRSVRGANGKWYKAAAADGRATLEINDRLVPVTATSVSDAPTIAAVSAEFLRKYAASPYAQSIVKPDTLPTTLRLEPG